MNTQNTDLLGVDAFRGFPQFSAIHGPEQARKIIENERIVLERVKEFVQKHNIKSDFNYTTTLDVCFNDDFADYQSKALEAYQAAGGDTSHVKFYQFKDEKEALAKTRVPGAVSAYEWPAASNHPAKLCQWILNSVIEKGGKLWTHCPAVKIVKHQDLNGSQGSELSKLRWDVHTPRGVVAAETVIHCTNAYSAYLLPGLDGFMKPRRAQAHSFVPTNSLAADNIINHTMSLRYGLHNYFSFIQLKDSTGRIILGGPGAWNGAFFTPPVLQEMTTFDDSKYTKEAAENSLGEFIKMAHPNLSSGSHTANIRHGEGLDHAWTGILGTTPDMVPLIGSVEGLDGQWVCAGFNGHGKCHFNSGISFWISFFFFFFFFVLLMV